MSEPTYTQTPDPWPAWVMVQDREHGETLARAEKRLRKKVYELIATPEEHADALRMESMVEQIKHKMEGA